MEQSAFLVQQQWKDDEGADENKVLDEGEARVGILANLQII